MKQNNCSIKEHICESEAALCELIPVHKKKFIAKKSPGCQMITTAAFSHKIHAAKNSFLLWTCQAFILLPFKTAQYRFGFNPNIEYVEKIAAYLKAQPGQNTITLE